APRTHGRRAERSRRALLRHLLPTVERANRVHRHSDRRSGREPGRRAASPPPVRRRGQGRLALHQLAGRVRLRRPRDLRHDAVSAARRQHDLLRRGHVDGFAAAGRRGGGQAPRATERANADPSALQWVRGAGQRHRDPRPRGARAARARRRDLRTPHRTDRRARPRRHGARPLLHVRAGAGVRAGRSRSRDARADAPAVRISRQRQRRDPGRSRV
ncbi:MAG: ATP-dependent Clp protease proteolytic subunit, partial [uncultured Solirubrobacterales bacterium]